MTRVFLFLAVCLSAGVTSAQRPPNIVFILADDLGYSELGSYGNTFNETRHLDQLALEGMRFTQAYASAPVCSPYRASLLTGQFPIRNGILDYLRPNDANPLTTDHVTIAELLREQGYATGLIGKWHLTGYRHHGAERELRAIDHGFDEEIASEVKGVGNGANFWPYVFRDQPIRWLSIDENRLGQGEYLLDRMNLEAVEFIERHKDEPFFLVLSHYGTHTILNGKPDDVAHFVERNPPGASTRERCYLCQDAGLEGDPQHHWAADHNPHLAAMLKSIDDGVGRIVATLESLGITDETLLVFTSDNGGETNVTSNAPLRGGKSQLYEGGIRVPLIVRWPGVVPAGEVNVQSTINTDFYPTFLDVAGAEPDERQQLDGVSILPSLRDPGQEPDRDALYWYYPLESPHFLGGRSGSAIRSGPWKLIESLNTGDVELFHLMDDPGEAQDLARSEPETAQRLLTELRNWRTSMGVESPMEPWMCQPVRLRFADAFEEDSASNRWFFQKEWTVADGALVRNEIPGENKRIFIQKPVFGDAAIEVDFEFRGAEELRIMTGTPGHYNAVILVWPDGFRVTTARDQSVPFYPTILGECPYDFGQNRRHTMRIEIHGDEILARVDDDHCIVGRHPILNRERTYFAFQVDQPGAAFDNIRIHDVAARQAEQWVETRQTLLEQQVERPWLPRSPEERLRDLQLIARDRLYRTDPAYRELVSEVDRCKADERRQFPDVFMTVKERQQQVQQRRSDLMRNDAAYNGLNDRINDARRAEVDYLHRQRPELTTLPEHQYPQRLEAARQQVASDEAFQTLIAARETLEAEQRTGYPELFRTNEDFLAAGRQARERHGDDPEFKALIQATAQAVRTEREYVIESNEEVSEIEREIQASRF